jgi:hypothetical protein
MRFIYYSILTLFSLNALSQTLPETLQKTKERLEGVEMAKGKATLNLDVDFINMPEKSALMIYEKGKPVSYQSENFIFIPKRGLDFGWNSLFDFKFITVDRGLINDIQTYNIIPDDERADFAIMTLKIDQVNYHIIEAEISTKNEGTYTINLSYDPGQSLPSEVIASFELEKVRIPLNFMGNDTDIDRKAMRADGQKTGMVYLNINWDIIEESSN